MVVKLCKSCTCSWVTYTELYGYGCAALYKGVFVSQLTAVGNILKYALNIIFPKKKGKTFSSLHAPLLHMQTHRIHNSLAL